MQNHSSTCLKKKHCALSNKKKVKEKLNALTESTAYGVEVKIDTWLDRKASKENKNQTSRCKTHKGYIAHLFLDKDIVQCAVKKR